jgi:hypothetical protein
MNTWCWSEGLQVGEAASLFGVSKETYMSWKYGKRQPHPWRLYQLILRGDPAVVDVARRMLWCFGDKYAI